MRAIVPLLLAVSLPLAAAPLHSQFLPPDDLSLRQEAPTAQQLLQVTDYSVVVGAQRQSDQQPIPITASLQMRLKGKPLSKGATISQVLLTFDGEAGKSLKKTGVRRQDPYTEPQLPGERLSRGHGPAAQRDGICAVPDVCQWPCLGRPAHRYRTYALRRAACGG